MIAEAFRPHIFEMRTAIGPKSERQEAELDTAFESITVIVNTLANRMQQRDSRFDREAFLRACGLI